MGVGWLGKATIPSRTGSGLSQSAPKDPLVCARSPLEGDLIEELGELFCQDAIAASEHKKQGWEQPRLDHIMASTSIGVDYIWGHARLGQFITPSNRSANQDGV